MSVWTFSDTHGNRQLFNAVMSKIGPNDIVYFLGDAIDRGPDGWAILKELLNDPRVIFIKGNHEDMMYKALAKWPRYFEESNDMLVWGFNGNEPTMAAILEDDPNVVRDILDKVAALPTFIEYTNPSGDIFWLSHAGCDYTEHISELKEEDLIWDRSHFLFNMWYHDNPNNLYIVHGHTPIPLLLKEMSYYNDGIPRETKIESGAYYYAGGHKIDIDCGAHFTGCTVLLNLDTFDEEVFMED